MSPEAAPRRPRLGLVIGSGGLKCAAALGLWSVLAREGITPDMAVGCSGGSIYAAAIALDWDLPTTIERNREIWSSVFRRRNVRSVLGAVFPRLLRFPENFGFLDDTALNENLRRVFAGARLETGKIPLSVVATELLSGEKVVLANGPVFDAIRASIAIPLALRPWSVGGRLLIDGGASDPLPVDVAVKEGCEIILAMGFEGRGLEAVDSAMKLTFQTMTITTNHLLKSQYAFYGVAHHAELIPIIPRFEKAVHLADTHLIPEIIEAGAAAAERELPYLKRLLSRRDESERRAVPR